MNTEKYVEDISAIRDIMTRSSRFISLSGLSGILAGIYALTAAAIVYFYLLKENEFLIRDSKSYLLAIVVALATIILSVATGIFLTIRKAKNQNEQYWDATTKKLLFHFFTPMVVGGLYILIMLDSHKYGLTAALMLIFYGLSLVGASKYTSSQIGYLGIIEIVLGLICAYIPGYGFWFWVIGFGFLHIIYGSLIYFKDNS